MNKLIAGVMGQDCIKFLPMCLKSLENADRIIYIDGGSKDGSVECAKKYGVEIIENEWDPEDKQMNGKQRNFYLRYLKNKYKDDWCLVLDADEVCEDINKIKEFIQTAQDGLYLVKMRHFIGDLGHEDATQQTHYVPNRLFKINNAITYPLESHPVLIGNPIFRTECTTIWHLGHLPVEYMKYIVKRYSQHKNDSIIHPKEWLKEWRDAHLYGTYPVRQINPVEIPKIILNNFGIDFDELYFKDRKTIEAKHYQDCIDWKNYFNPKGVILWGCGIGQRVYVLNQLGVNAYGVELSQYAVDNSITNVIQGDIRTFKPSQNQEDLHIAYDVLEHLEYRDLDKAINSLMKTKKYILISVPFKGNPNLEADPTHIIKEDRDWWIKQFTDKGMKLIETPNNFLYKHQILIFKGIK